MGYLSYEKVTLCKELVDSLKNKMFTCINMFGPISSAYYDLVNQGNLQEDLEQDLLVKRLDVVWKKLHKPFWCSYFNKSLKGLYIAGDVGRGKTYLMDLFYDKVKIPKIRLHYHIFINKLHEELIKHPENPWRNLAIDFYKKAKLLCLDEFQFYDVGDVMILHHFFKHFFALGGVLVTTSNLHPTEFSFSDELHKIRFLEFILTYIEVFSLDKGPDYRLKGKESCRKFFINEEAPSLGDFFKRNLRKDLKECTYNFHKLFEAPVGISYYSNLLKKCDALVITDFKQLNDDNENSLIRFMQLIDLLYESKTSLSLYSSVGLKNIYAGNKYKRPFKRTLSRLLEITSR